MLLSAILSDGHGSQSINAISRIIFFADGNPIDFTMSVFFYMHLSFVGQRIRGLRNLQTEKRIRVMMIEMLRTCMIRPKLWELVPLQHNNFMCPGFLSGGIFAKCICAEQIRYLCTHTHAHNMRRE